MKTNPNHNLLVFPVVLTLKYTENSEHLKGLGIFVKIQGLKSMIQIQDTRSVHNVLSLLNFQKLTKKCKHRILHKSRETAICKDLYKITAL